MLNLKNLLIIAIASSFFMGCSVKTAPLPLADTMSKSYAITKGMTPVEVTAILPMQPTSIQRINNEETWKYEGNTVSTETKANTYHNLIIKFIDGKMEHIGTFSCNLPVTQGK